MVNKFMNATNKLLAKYYEEYKIWKTTGIIPPDGELRKAADQYIEEIPGAWQTTCMVDLLDIIAERWEMRRYEIPKEESTTKYLLCTLNDEEYTSPYFSIYDHHEQAYEEALLRCGFAWNSDMNITVEEDQMRISSHAGNSFFVTEIKGFDASAGEYMLVWHHAYNGVGFNILCVGTYEECEKKRKDEIKKIFSEYDLSKADNEGFDIEIDNVVDTGEEWEVFSIIKIEDKMAYL